MASMRHHEVTEIWRRKPSDVFVDDPVRYHITKNGWVLRTEGKMGGVAKLMRMDAKGRVVAGRPALVVDSTLRRLTVDEFIAHAARHGYIKLEG